MEAACHQELCYGQECSANTHNLLKYLTCTGITQTCVTQMDELKTSANETVYVETVQVVGKGKLRGWGEGKEVPS